jgi:PPOX class probable F420-dependent enzyme
MDAGMELAAAPYVSLSTFRRNGQPVDTPVWCAASGDDFFVFSAGNAGKVKRLRNSSRARMGVCDVRGKLLGDWHDAEAELISEPEEIERALDALRAKYGWQMWLADVGSKLTGKFNRRAYIRLRLST